ncbi:hypothetical protein PGKDCPLP_01777 [Stenotrophomonas maltophilia]|nr:hypothetical protein PGKDCPLP_01777 [Stenotrophomonas maltophilia]
MLHGQQVHVGEAVEQAIFAGQRSLPEIALQQGGIALAKTGDVDHSADPTVEIVQWLAQAEHRREPLQVVFVAAHQCRHIVGQADRWRGGADLGLAQLSPDLDRPQQGSIFQPVGLLRDHHAVAVGAEHRPATPTEGRPELFQLRLHATRQAPVIGMGQMAAIAQQRPIVRLLPRLQARRARTQP